MIVKDIKIFYIIDRILVHQQFVLITTLHIDQYVARDQLE